MSKELSEQDVRRFREKLRGIVDQASKASESIEAESLRVGGPGLDTEGDEGVDQEFEDVDLDVLEVEESTLRAARDALERMAEGTYGRCTECGAWIAKGRLEVMPYAPHCITCQEAQESGTA